MVQGIYYSRLECVLDLGMVTLGLQLDAGESKEVTPRVCFIVLHVQAMCSVEVMLSWVLI